METKDCQGIRQRNINDIDKAEREIRPKIAPITKISHSADHWLKKNMDIDRDIRSLVESLRSRDKPEPEIPYIHPESYS